MATRFVMLLFIFLLTNAGALAHDGKQKDSFSLSIPTSISPNSCGYGGTMEAIFLVKSNCPLKSYKISIYNRWGELLFKNQNIKEHWDPEKMPIGVYFYIINAQFENGRKLEHTGSITYFR